MIHQLKKVRPNLAQGFTGPHLYPLAQMSLGVLRTGLDNLKEAAFAGHRHASYGMWRLLFIHKKGRDRYDLKNGCRPIVCLSHLLCLDEGMVQALFLRHVDAVRTDINKHRIPCTRDPHPDTLLP